MNIDIKMIIGIIISILIIGGAFGYLYTYKNWFAPSDQVLKIPNSENGTKILFLHHSTGSNIWNGGVKEWFAEYNKTNNLDYKIVEQEFPKHSPYGWENYPYDYWDIWVKHAGNESYKKEPTLEMITKEYDVVIWKHCFPVSNIKEDTGTPQVSSEVKRLENYKAQYNALKEKMKEFPNTKFIVWTITPLVEKSTTEQKAKRTKEFYEWEKNEWNEDNDNIFLWDFYKLETEGGLYLKNENAESSDDSHPNSDFSKKVAPYFCQRVVDVIEGNGDAKKITGKP